MRLHGSENIASNSLSNGHALSPADKSVSISGRHVPLLDGRQISRLEHVSTSGATDGRIGPCNEQFSKISVSEGRGNISSIEQSTLPGTVGLARADQLAVTNTDIRSHNRTEPSASVGRNSRAEQLIAAPHAESFGTVRADQLSTSLADGYVVSRVDQPATSTLTDNQGISQTEQSAVFTLSDGTCISRPEQATVYQTSQNNSEQSTALLVQEGRRIPCSEQSMPTTRSNPRVVQRVTSITGQTAVAPSQSTTQAGSSIILTEVEPATQSEEPLPPGWEMRYDIYGRRLYYFQNMRNKIIFR